MYMEIASYTPRAPEQYLSRARVVGTSGVLGELPAGRELPERTSSAPRVYNIGSSGVPVAPPATVLPKPTFGTNKASPWGRTVPMGPASANWR